MVSEIENTTRAVMKQNQSLLSNRYSNMGMFQIKRTYLGNKITLGFNNGKVEQFYTR